MTTPENKAAWIPSPMAPLKVDKSPYPIPEQHQLIIRVHAAAVNPVDHAVATQGVLVPHEKYPIAFGCDFAGEIVGIGDKVKDVYGGKGAQFKVGDRVTGACHEMEKEFQGAYQHYCAADAALCAKIPDEVAYADACVIPLALMTAAAGLFQKNNLALPIPGAATSEELEKHKGKWVLIWGAASAVGSNAVQMCKAVGLRVAVTASKANEEYCKSLGADMIFDYKEDGVVSKIIEALKPHGKDFLGVLNCIITKETLLDCGEIVRQLPGVKKIGTVLPGFFPLLKELPTDIKYCDNYGSSIEDDEVGAALFGSWIAKALASGELKCLPEKKVVGKGLENVQTAMKEFGKGVSARKIVIEL